MTPLTGLTPLQVLAAVVGVALGVLLAWIGGAL